MRERRHDLVPDHQQTTPRHPPPLAATLSVSPTHQHMHFKVLLLVPVVSLQSEAQPRPSVHEVLIEHDTLALTPQEIGLEG